MPEKHQRSLIQENNIKRYESIRIALMQSVPPQISRHVLCSRLASQGFSGARSQSPHLPSDDTDEIDHREAPPGDQHHVHNSEVDAATNQSNAAGHTGSEPTTICPRYFDRPASDEHESLETGRATEVPATSPTVPTASAAASQSTRVVAAVKLDCTSCHCRVELTVTALSCTGGHVEGEGEAENPPNAETDSTQMIIGEDSVGGGGHEAASSLASRTSWPPGNAPSRSTGPRVVDARAPIESPPSHLHLSRKDQQTLNTHAKQLVRLEKSIRSTHLAGCPLVQELWSEEITTKSLF